ncbi:MAG: hypothetical protein AAFN41_04295 [Planctomycetota bacterium]
MRSTVILLAIAATATAIAQPIVHEVAELIPPSLSSGDDFGDAVAISDEVVAVGAPGDDDQGDNAGAVYLFNGQTYGYLTTITPPIVQDNQRFGFALETGNNAVFVGAPFTEDPQGRERGKVYLYGATGIGPVREFEPEPTNEAEPNDLFGWSIASRPGLVAIGAPLDDGANEDGGAVYVFVNSLPPIVIRPDDQNDGDHFGWSVALDGDLLLVGAPEHTSSLQSKGAAYVFDVSTGDQLAKVASPIVSSAATDFGSAVSVRNNRLLIGARFADTNAQNAGQAFTYIYDPSTQSVLPETTLAEPLPAQNARFGGSASIGDGITAIGAPSNAPSGEAFVYTNGQPTPFARFFPSIPEGLAQFGEAIDTDGERFTIGAYFSLDGGRAFVFEKPLEALAQPRDFIAIPNDIIELLFQVGALGSEARYQWRKDGQPISDLSLYDGFDTEQLFIVAGPQTIGVYDCVVTTQTQTIISDSAIVAVRNDCPADQNFDGILDPADFNAWVLNYHRGCDAR